ncbi:hypothetical protein [Sinomonas susongensis]|uniref:hypothetical protein n=1 Tax=Sinomonas susongensis TaxID=1324851 RepID=UPI001107D30D|nr:hypothetical protein [Sinomonas susongensis]
METEAVLTFTSHIEGKNAKVHVYRDRIEWGKNRHVINRAAGQAGRAVLAGSTFGLSLLGGGVSKVASPDMIPMRQITGVTTKRDGLINSKVCVITSGDTIEFRVSHGDAANIKNVISQLMLAV